MLVISLLHTDIGLLSYAGGKMLKVRHQMWDACVSVELVRVGVDSFILKLRDDPATVLKVHLNIQHQLARPNINSTAWENLLSGQ